MAARRITVAGAGILGLWQALELARRGHRVRLLEREAVPFAASASRFAGAMLAPDCEAEAAPQVIREAGHRGLALWRAAYPGLTSAGTLVVSAPRDRSELDRFDRATKGHIRIQREGLAALEPDLAGRFEQALYFANEAHMATPAALDFLLKACLDAGVEVRFGSTWQPGPGEAKVPAPATASVDASGEIVIDCRGLQAQGDIPGLRGVRGERILIGTTEITLSRPVRLLHPRHPIYVVPWGQGRFMVGATVIESEDAGAASVRSVLELMGAAFALHPAFGEAEILDVAAGVRPAFADNVPRAIFEAGGQAGGAGRRSGALIRVNGAYRHGFLLAPVLAEAVAGRLADPAFSHPLIIEEAP